MEVVSRSFVCRNYEQNYFLQTKRKLDLSFISDLYKNKEINILSIEIDDDNGILFNWDVTSNEYHFAIFLVKIEKEIVENNIDSIYWNMWVEIEDTDINIVHGEDTNNVSLFLEAPIHIGQKMLDIIQEIDEMDI